MNIPVNFAPSISAKPGYELFTEHVDDLEPMGYTTYGIRIKDPGGNVLLTYPDISTDIDFVQGFIAMIANHDVALIHIPDLLEDYLD